MERKIGEIFEYNGEWYQCICSSDCSKCDLKIIQYCRHKFPCESLQRNDREEVIFKKLEKVGEPYMDGGKIMQKYKRVYREPIYFPYKELNCYNDLHGRICIEIKQTKEDMEEKDIKPYDKIFSEGTVSNTENLVTSSLKPFDLEAAKAGKPVCTRDGRKARIICFDRKFYYNECNYTIVAMVNEDDDNDNEFIHGYTQNGLLVENAVNELDLMMLPEKKEGWAVIRRSDIYKTEEQAKEVLLNSRVGVMIRKIEWEE